MLQTERLPVRVYRSTDTDAPVLDAVAGNLKTLLKACLVTGYGQDSDRREPLGWEMPFEAAERAVFASADPKSNRHCLRVDSADGRFSVFDAFRTMSSLDDVSGRFGAPGRKFGVTDQYSRPVVTGWLLVGHSRAFVLIASGRDGTAALFFGDAPSYLAGDTGNTLYWSSQSGYPYFFASTPRSINYNGTPVHLAGQTANPDAAAECILLSIGFYNAGTAYPDPVTGGFTCADVYVSDTSAAKTTAIRCKQPGLLKCFNDLRPLGQLATVTDGDGVPYAVCSLSNYDAHTWLVNLAEWEA